MLFDVPLHYHFTRHRSRTVTSTCRACGENMLTASIPELSVTFVENHDTQPDNPGLHDVISWFKRGRPRVDPPE